jgi:hypothetical protein
MNAVIQARKIATYESLGCFRYKDHDDKGKGLRRPYTLVSPVDSNPIMALCSIDASSFYGPGGSGDHALMGPFQIPF